MSPGRSAIDLLVGQSIRRTESAVAARRGSSPVPHRQRGRCDAGHREQRAPYSRGGRVSAPLYKYVNIEVLKRILNGSIRFTQPSAFNDPFELLPAVVVPNDAVER